jgi:hypothetical protein
VICGNDIGRFLDEGVMFDVFVAFLETEVP